jgi:hypothetical protein
VIVCPRCKTENADGRIRCGSCGNNISKRGEYAQGQGPKVVVLGSVEDLRRAREAGDLDTSDDDSTALGWLDDSDVGKAEPAAAEPPRTRRVSVKEIDKISGLKDLRDIQKALLGGGQEEKPVVEKPKRIERPTTRATPAAEKAPERPAEKAPEKPAASTASKPSEPAAAWLACELLSEPVALALGKRYLIGRDPKAAIVLPAGEISKHHAGISSDEKGEFSIEDLKSMNGTYVNGCAVLKRKLREGDVIDVGPFAFRFSLAKAGAAPPRGGCDPGEETRAARAIPGALTGEIEKNGVGAVLQMLHAARRSGVLTLRAGPQVGRIFLVEGEIHHAQFGKAQGEQALASLIPAEAGLLHFTDERIKVKRTIERSTDEIFGG